MNVSAGNVVFVVSADMKGMDMAGTRNDSSVPLLKSSPTGRSRYAYFLPGGENS